MEIAIIILAAFVLDMLFGDPRWLYHPIVAIGKLISIFEKILRHIFPKTEKGELIGGFFLTVLVVGISFIIPFLALKYIGMVDIRLRYVLETFWCWQIFAAKSLKKESMRVYKEIETKNLSGARKYLSWIVGRDTAELDFKQITKAVVETVAENTSDGVIAPMMFMFIGGAPLGFLYKAINTLDSMVGYKNDQYMFFGRFSAKVDDVANYVPARITGVAIAVGSFFVGLNTKNSFKVLIRDRRNHKSPNSGYPESACAGALSVQLAGDAYYFGKLFKKKTIGDDIRPIEPFDIVKTNRLMYSASVLSLIVIEAVVVALNILI